MVVALKRQWDGQVDQLPPIGKLDLAPWKEHKGMFALYSSCAHTFLCVCVCARVRKCAFFCTCVCVCMRMPNSNTQKRMVVHGFSCNLCCPFQCWFFFFWKHDLPHLSRVLKLLFMLQWKVPVAIRKCSSHFRVAVIWRKCFDVHVHYISQVVHADLVRFLILPPELHGEIQVVSSFLWLAILVSMCALLNAGVCAGVWKRASLTAPAPSKSFLWLVLDSKDVFLRHTKDLFFFAECL